MKKKPKEPASIELLLGSIKFIENARIAPEIKISLLAEAIVQIARDELGKKSRKKK